MLGEEDGVGETDVAGAGDGEVNAAFGLLQLQHIDHALQRRREIDQFYRLQLQNVPGIRLVDSTSQITANYSYFPILVDADYPLSRDALYQKLKDNNVFGRRYFYPLISNFPMYRGMSSAQRNNLPIANAIAEQVICLPIYPALDNKQLNRVTTLLQEP